MSWTGKIVGVLLGLLTRRWQFIVLGFVIGHLFDMGLFRAKRASPANPPARAPADDPYAVLGVSVSSSDEEIEQAWRRKMSEYHPDRVANAADEIRALAETRAREINSAYETIQQQRRRG
ncbi:DnaJ domain-containing protein [Arenimonas sp.]|uniref:J domain-containing protein n=1 Tax=Arenimonas sp. TaxID=1872635 RepID=UPI0039E356CF